MAPRSLDSRSRYRRFSSRTPARYNVVAIPLAAAAFAWAGLTLPPLVGAVLMSPSTMVVAANAQLLRRVRLLPDTAPTRAAS